MKPLYMWAGGKSRLIPKYRAAGLVPSMGGSTYVEPFLGGGAMFAHLAPKGPCVLNDVNAEVIEMLRCVRDDPQGLLDELLRLRDEYFSADDRKTWYYQQRSAYWSAPSPGRLYVLMKLGFNGVWQTCAASGGLYGTPAGLLNHVRPEQVVDEALIHEWSEALRPATLLSDDFEWIHVDDDAFVFADPPYRGSFTTYGTGFDDEDQDRLCSWLSGLSERGVRVALSNRVVEGDSFFEDRLPGFEFHYFDVMYTAGRRKRGEAGFEAKAAVEFLAVNY